MLVTGTPAAAAIIERVKGERRGSLSITIGTGCCESTAPFLYEDFWPGPDQEQVGEIAGVPVFAPEYLRCLYQGDDGVVIDVVEGELLESLSVETELGVRLVLRNRDGALIPGQGDASPELPRAVAPEVSALRRRGPQELPEALRRARMR